MAFDSLTEKLQNIFKNLRSKGRLTEDDVKEALKEIKRALLAADVNFKVVKDFIKNVQERAIGQDVMNGLNPGQMVVKIVNEELVKLMGSETTEIKLQPGSAITVIMMAGLQGAGKTTTTAKLAGKFKLKGKKPLLVACDVYRPAAIKQLQINGEKQGVEVFSMGENHKPANIAKAALLHAQKNKNNIVILDTAGRLHIDEDMMAELQEIKDTVDVHQTILVIDAMTGQDAVNVAKDFNDKIGIDGVIVTKLDGDTRGGAALSVKAVTGKPILYVGMGEKLSDLEQFYPERMASRILGMGDVLTLIEKAEAEGKTTVRLHTGDPCIYGAIREQMDILDEKNITYDYCPGVSAFCGAASALNLEYTLPDISQSVIITRMEGRTPVPSKESIQSFAAHQATMVVFLSTGMLEELSRRLIEGGYTADTPAAIVYKATWPEQKTFVCTVGTLAKTAAENNITKTALMIIGDTVAAAHYDRSKLYDPEFTTEFREAVKSKTHHS